MITHKDVENQWFPNRKMIYVHAGFSTSNCKPLNRVPLGIPTPRGGFVSHGGIRKSSILIGFFSINQPFWGTSISVFGRGMRCYALWACKEPRGYCGANGCGDTGGRAGRSCRAWRKAGVFLGNLW